MSRQQYIVAWSLAIIGSIAMTVVIAHGFIHGNFRQEGRWLLDHPWGRVTLVDLYLGFLLFGGWVFQRERDKRVAAAWLVGLLLLGHLTAAVYVIRALMQSRGKSGSFWMGVNATDGRSASPGDPNRR